jgi:hypothetical protein
MNYSRVCILGIRNSQLEIRKAIFKDCNNLENDEEGRANVFNFFVEEFKKEYKVSRKCQ